MSLSIAIDRTALSLTALTITDTIGAYFVEADSLTDPGLDMRRTYAPDSAFVPGKQLLAAVLDASFLPFNVIVTGTSAADLAAKKNALAAAVSQFSYAVTLTVGGQTTTWHADPTWPSWGQYAAAMDNEFMARAVLQIPINP